MTYNVAGLSRIIRLLVIQKVQPNLGRHLNLKVNHSYLSHAVLILICFAAVTLSAGCAKSKSSSSGSSEAHQFCWVCFLFQTARPIALVRILWVVRQPKVSL